MIVSSLNSPPPAELEPIVPEIVGSAEVVVEPAVAQSHGGGSRLDRGWRGVRRAVYFLFSVLSCLVGLAIVATIPIVQLAALGYLLEVGGRMVRTGRLSHCFIGLDKAAQFGTWLIGALLLIVPLGLLSRVATAARLIAPESRADRWLTWILWAGVTLGVIHFAGACWQGARLRHFLLPRPRKVWQFLVGLVTLRGVYADTRDLVWNYLVGLRLPYYWWLGLRGGLGALVWLVPPVTLIVLGKQVPALGFLGGLAGAVVLLYLPFLQARFAAQNRWRALFEVRQVRQLFCRAPVAFFVAQFLTLLLGVPLYVFKIEMLAPDAVWMAALVFVAFSWPARWLVGWALVRAERRELPRSRAWRWSMRGLMLTAAGAYIGLVFFTQFTSWHGARSLYAQHPFLVPVPFLGN